jgi:prepilin-type N-terminal cleavage/methylation domain-containing protein
VKASKNHSGFSLIEIIVASVIISILAAVAIPLYTGYVNDARQELVLNLARTAAVSANAYIRNPNNPALPTGDLKSTLKIFLNDSVNFDIRTISGNQLRVTDKIHSIQSIANY